MELVEYTFTQAYKDKTPINVMPLGDIQWTGQPGDIATQILQRRIDYGLKHKAWFVGMGDYIDYASPSNRTALRNARLYDNARNVHDNAARALTDEVYEKFLKPTTGRWLGLLEGHHFFEFQTGVTSDQYLCEKLKAPFLGTCGYIGMHFNLRRPENEKGTGNTGTVNIWCHHGMGNGVSPAAPINKLNQILPDWEADIFLIGHMTKQATAATNRIYPSWTKGKRGFAKLRHMDKFLVGTGGFGKGYIERSSQGKIPRGTYVEAGMMRPAALGCPMIRIYPQMKTYKYGKRTAVGFAPSIVVETGG